jgi:membrane protein
MYIFIVIGLLFLTLIFNLLYSFLPSVHKTFRSQRYGAIFTTIAWIIFSFFFQLWVTLSKNLSILYGGLLTIIIALTWMYFLVYIFFLGAEINDFIENPNTFPE